eukprot:3759972-Lingulodinium_polyedra.AAC.1
MVALWWLYGGSMVALWWLCGEITLESFSSGSRVALDCARFFNKHLVLHLGVLSGGCTVAFDGSIVDLW